MALTVWKKYLKVNVKVAQEECRHSSHFRNRTQRKRSMEFLPIEKYSWDKKTAKHKKDVAKLQKKAVVKELKAEGKVKTRTANLATTAAANAQKVKSKRAIQKIKAVKPKGNTVAEKSETFKEKSKPEKAIPKSVEKQREVIRSALTKSAPDNRLFVNMKKKILNTQEVKDLHPDIMSITMPRQKCSSWCWAVFESKAKAVKALKMLQKRKDIIVNHALSEDSKKEKREKKLKKVKLKKAMKKTLRETWQ